MTTMIEQVAREIYGASPRDAAWSLLTVAKRTPFIDQARAAIEVMREPTEAMLSAGGMRSGEQYRAMIDAALNEKEPT